MTLFNIAPQISQQQPTNFSNNTTTSFSLTTATTTIAPDRPARNRKGVMLYNAGTANAIFNLGTTISPTIFTAELWPGGYFHDPTGWQGPIVARATSSPTVINVTEPIVII